MSEWETILDIDVIKRKLVVVYTACICILSSQDLKALKRIVKLFAKLFLFFYNTFPVCNSSAKLNPHTTFKVMGKALAVVQQKKIIVQL